MTGCPALEAAGACQTCCEKMQSMVEVKNQRVRRLVGLLDASLPKVVADLASQYLVFSKPSCWGCKISA